MAEAPDAGPRTPDPGRRTPGAGPRAPDEEVVSAMTDRDRVSFGIKTTQWRVSYDDILACWRDADTVPEIEHAWLWDHLVPLRGEATGPLHEAWTLLAALAGQTERLRLGLMVSSNRTRPPAVLAKMAATTDVISHGRLVFGIGVGATRVPGENPGVREYEAYGLPLVSPREGVEALSESCTIARRLWTEGPFDFDGRHYQLKGAVCEPKPVQRPHPPVLIGGTGEKGTLRVVAEHADIWNCPGPPWLSVEEFRRKSGVLDDYCAAIGRDPREITRSVQILVRREEETAATRALVAELIAAGVRHVVLAPAFLPYPPARWLVDEIIAPVMAETPVG
jgi:alkanesulfonate monooxygenase SsuD/methylene tetrahydromethanopterin reductase-like flavin-dependent oxidoreductase (luciferase family)